MNAEVLTCPECEEGSLVRGTREIVFEHKGAQLRVDALECYRCNACGTETVKPDQIRRNQIRISDAKRHADGYLTGEQIRRLRESLSLSQADAALLFGGGTNGFSKYERGEVIQSVSMDRLLRVVATYPWLLEFLRVQAGLESQGFVGGTYIDTQAVSLNDPSYRSRPVVGSEIVVSAQKRESTVVSLSDWGKKKVA